MQILISIMFLRLQVVEPITMDIGIFVPAIAIGIVGGILGALFVHLNYAICRIRKRIVATISPWWLANVFRMVESMLLAVRKENKIISLGINTYIYRKS